MKNTEIKEQELKREWDIICQKQLEQLKGRVPNLYKAHNFIYYELVDEMRKIEIIENKTSDITKKDRKRMKRYIKKADKLFNVLEVLRTK
jgi:hypothetical protein